VNIQLDSWCSIRTYYRPNAAVISFYFIALSHYLFPVLLRVAG